MDPESIRKLERQARIAYAAGFAVMLAVLVAARLVSAARTPEPAPEPAADRDAEYRERERRRVLGGPTFALGVEIAIHEEACEYLAENLPTASAAVAIAGEAIAKLRATMELGPAALRCSAEPTLLTVLEGEIEPGLWEYALYGHMLFKYTRVVEEVDPSTLREVEQRLGDLGALLGAGSSPDKRLDLPHMYEHFSRQPWVLPNALSVARREHRKRGPR